MCVSSENKNAKNPKQNHFVCFSPVGSFRETHLM